MAKILFINDLINPKIGSAMSLKPILDSLSTRYYQNVFKTMRLHAIQDKDNYIIHSMIPSEGNSSYEKAVFYDVIIEFYPHNKEVKGDTSLKRYGVKVYSNCPTYTFNYTYVYNKAGAIPSFVPSSYYNKQALKKPPKVNNPYELYGIEKSIWYTITYMSEVFDFRKHRMNLVLLEKTKPSDLLKDVMSQEEKLEEINMEKKKLHIKNKKSKNKIKENNKISSKQKKQSKMIKKIENNLKTDFKSKNIKKNNLSTNTLKFNGIKKKKNGKIDTSNIDLRAIL